MVTLHHKYSSTPLQLQLQLHDTTLRPAVVGELTLETIATTSKSTTPTTFRSISGFPLPSVTHNNQPLLEVSHFEPSAAALCGTIGMKYLQLFVLLQVSSKIHTAPSQTPQVLSAKERRRKKDHVRGSAGLCRRGAMAL